MNACWLTPRGNSSLTQTDNRSAGLGCARLIAGLMLMAVSAAHGASCSITSLSGLNFANYDPFSASPLDGAATATIFCSTTKSSETVTVSVSLGIGLAGSYSPRQMQGPLDKLNYNLYIDAGRTQILGDGSGGTYTDNGSASISKNNPITFTETIYGRVFAGQDPGVGSYGDSLTYTVNF